MAVNIFQPWNVEEKCAFHTDISTLKENLCFKPKKKHQKNESCIMVVISYHGNRIFFKV